MGLTILQPWFYTPGHSAASTYLTCRVLAKYSPLSLILLAPARPSESHYEIKRMIGLIPNVEIIEISSRLDFDRSGKNFSRQSTQEILHAYKVKDKRDSPVLIFDSCVIHVGLALLLRPRLFRVKFNLIELWNPEAYLARRWGFFKSIAVGLFFLNNKNKLLLRTRQLAYSWKEKFPRRHSQIYETQSLELSVGQVCSRMPEKRRRTFSITGQMRPEKNYLEVANAIEKIDGAVLCLAGKFPRPPDIQPSAKIRVLNKFLSNRELEQIIEKSEYHVLLYNNWDGRMESGSLFTSIRCLTPVVCWADGWLGAYVAESGVGVCIPKSINLPFALSQLPILGDSAYIAMVRACVRNISERSSERFIRGVLDKLQS